MYPPNSTYQVIMRCSWESVPAQGARDETNSTVQNSPPSSGQAARNRGWFPGADYAEFRWATGNRERTRGEGSLECLNAGFSIYVCACSYVCVCVRMCACECVCL